MTSECHISIADEAVAVADAITAQLALGPTAELKCPLGWFVVELVPFLA